MRNAQGFIKAKGLKPGTNVTRYGAGSLHSCCTESLMEESRQSSRLSSRSGRMLGRSHHSSKFVKINL